MREVTLLLPLALLSAGPGCDLAYPEVVIVNRTSEHLLLKDASFNGCVWNGVLGYGDATLPARCLAGEGRVHFKKLDLRAQAPEAEPSADAATEPSAPLWFSYRTVSVRRVDYGDFQVLEIGADDLEQDFSVPGPYGH